MEPGHAFQGVSRLLDSLSDTPYAVTNLAYLVKRERTLKVLEKVAHLVLAASIVFGATQTSDVAWAMADFGVGLYTWVNILALVLLSPIAIRLVKDYDRQRREGKDPVLDPRAIGVHNAPFWESLHEEYERTGDAVAAMTEVADSAPDTAVVAVVDRVGQQG